MRICQYGLLVDDALGFENVSFISIEPVYTSLHRLLDHELLYDQVRIAPVLHKICDKLILTEVDSYVSLSPFWMEYLQNVLRWNDAIRLFLNSTSLI